MDTLDVFAGMLQGVQVDRERLAQASAAGALLATDLADYLVGKGVAFREAHGHRGRPGTLCGGAGQRTPQLGAGGVPALLPKFAADVLDITAQRSVAARNVPGGTAPEQVAQALQEARRVLEGQSGA